MNVIRKTIVITMIAAMCTGGTVLAAEETEAEKEELVFATFGEALQEAGENPVIMGSEEYYVVMLEEDGTFLRVVAQMDETGKEKMRSSYNELNYDKRIALDEDLNEYIKTLPISYTEEITAEPLNQEELDDLTGKTILEVEEMGYENESSGRYGPKGEPVYTVTYGLFNYDLLLNESYDVYQEHEDNGYYGDLTVKSALYAGPSQNMADLDYLADGTFAGSTDDLPGSFDLGEENEFLDSLFGSMKGEEGMDPDALIESLIALMPDKEEEIRELIPFFAIFNGSEDEVPEDPERFGTLEWYSTFTAGSTIKDSFYYSDDWFLEDPEIQNNALALVSMQLTAAAVPGDENGTGTTFLKNMGFEETGLSGFGEADPEGCNFTWGTKTIGSGEDAFTLVVVAIQSHSLVQEEKQTGWRQNFLVNEEDITVEQASYANAADHAAEEIAQLGLSGNVKYWITGQSRGGAIAGILAVRLKDEGNSVYAYTFEAPANVEQYAIEGHEQDYGYIHNYLCSDDIVTMIPPWGMTRYGTEHRLNTEETTQPLPQMLQKIGSDAAGAAETYDPEAIESISAGLIQVLSDRIPTREEYSSLHTDTFTGASGNEVSVSYRYQDLFVSLMQVVFGNVLEGIDTDRLAEEMPQLLPAVSALYQAVKEESDPMYYEAATQLATFLEKAGIELPLALEDLYALLKLAGPVMINAEFVPESGTITLDDMFQCIGPVIELFEKKNTLIFSHQFDTVIARLKLLAEEPAMENLEISLAEPVAGEETASFASQAETAAWDLGYSWLTASAEVLTQDETFRNDKSYYLSITLSSAGHSIPGDFAITMNGEEPVEPLGIAYADGITSITGTWKYVLGTPEQVQVSFDMEGHGEAPEPVSVDTGAVLKLSTLPEIPEFISDETGSWSFDGWYDEDGIFWEDVSADKDLTLHAKWNRMIDNIEISFDIPHLGEETVEPDVPEDAPYEAGDVWIMNEEWEFVTEISAMGQYTMNFEVFPDSEETQFLITLNEDGYEIYAGVLTVNGEAAENWYDADGNCITVSCYFTPLP
ncbi:MAG: hypothetical protein IJ106_05825 [Parasporobacterium sp.]|nr:hypothetical protein [Parasporobacterium sp.]